VQGFAARVVAWQHRHGRRDLPWQRSRDAYRIWLSEVMLQQTQVPTVVPYFERFVREFPDVESLARAPLERVLELWSGLGYYTRARNLHRAAQIVTSEHGGVFPDDPQRLTSLPGVGRSTAAAIAAFAFGVRTPILDGNVKRVLARHCGIDGYPGAKDVEAELWRVAERRMRPLAKRREDVSAYTQGLMDLGAAVCTRRRPTCPLCPVRRGCVALATGRTQEIPAPRPKRVLPRRETAVLILRQGRRILLERRPARGVWGGLWSLPEAPVDIDVVRYCRDRFDARIAAVEYLPTVEHAFTHFRLTMHPVHAHVAACPTAMREAGQTWLEPADASGAALPAPIRRLVASLDWPAP